MEIQHQPQENKGAFVAIENEVKAGEITYIKSESDKIIIEHTNVNPDFKGRGVGKELVLAAVDFARKNNVKILPLCPFVKATFDKNKDLQDVLV